MEDLATAVNTPKKFFLGTENESRNETEAQPNVSFNITSLPGPSTCSPNSVCQNSSMPDPSTSSTSSLQKIEEPKSNNQTNTSLLRQFLTK